MMRYHKYIISILLLIVLTRVCFLSGPQPLVSVILPTYNRENLLPTAIQSILNQTYQNIEFIIINDASTDNTSTILKRYKNKRIRIITNQTHQGIVYNRNLGLSLAKGKYVAWIDDDDISKPNRLEKQVKYMESHPDITILGTEISQLNSDEKIYLWPTETEPQKAEIVFLIGRLPVVIGTTMFRKSFFDTHHILFQQNIPLSEDLPIYDQVLANGGKIMTLPATLYEYRIHRSNPKEYYHAIGKIKKQFFKNRWKSFFKDSEYPKTQCQRLKFIQKNNNGLFEQKLLNEMVNHHCKTDIFYPTNEAQLILFPDNHSEWVIVSKNTHRFYSKYVQKYGLMISGTTEKAMILWDGDTEPTTYLLQKQTSDDL